MQKNRYVNAVLDDVETHLSEPLTPETIAQRHFVSLRQLYRDFYSHTGHSVKEYIRKRRISNACEKIKCSDLPLVLIAEESGYQTQQAFHKQFKNVVGMTPLEYRQKETYFYFYPFSVHEISLVIRVGMESIPECTVTQFYDPCLIGIEDKAIAELGEITGRVFGRNGKQVKNRFCYEVMTERSGEGKTGLYASCVVNYNEAEINDGWNYLYNTWLSASMFEKSDDGYFEEYLFSGGKPCKLKLYLPVRKRKADQHITIASVGEISFLAAREKGPRAEHSASEKVMAFCQRWNPLLLRNAKRFYVCVHDDVVECGIECGDGLTLPENSDLQILRIPAGRYAILPDDRLGDVRIGGEKMDRWLANNNIAHESEPIFAIYETANGQYDLENIRMTLYKRLKMAKKDNTTDLYGDKIKAIRR